MEHFSTQFYKISVPSKFDLWGKSVIELLHLLLAAHLSFDYY